MPRITANESRKPTGPISWACLCAAVLACAPGCYEHVVEQRGLTRPGVKVHQPAEEDLFLLKDLEEITKEKQRRPSEQRLPP